MTSEFKTVGKRFKSEEKKVVIKFSGVEKNVDETWVLILKQSPHESDNRKPLNNGLLR